jgi:ribosomal protein S18 acetylase RimI-like enzyme
LKEYRGQGIGRDLYELAREMIKMKGYDRFFISCNKYNELGRKFYEAIGGKIVEENPDNEDKSIPQVIFHYDI